MSSYSIPYARRDLQYRPYIQQPFYPEVYWLQRQPGYYYCPPNYPGNPYQHKTKQNAGNPQFSSFSQWIWGPDAWNTISSAGKQYLLDRLPLIMEALPAMSIGSLAPLLNISSLGPMFLRAVQTRRLLRNPSGLFSTNLKPRGVVDRLRRGARLPG